MRRKRKPRPELRPEEEDWTTRDDLYRIRRAPVEPLIRLEDLTYSGNPMRLKRRGRPQPTKPSPMARETRPPRMPPGIGGVASEIPVKIEVTHKFEGSADLAKSIKLSDEVIREARDRMAVRWGGISQDGMRDIVEEVIIPAWIEAMEDHMRGLRGRSERIQ